MPGLMRREPRGEVLTRTPAAEYHWRRVVRPVSAASPVGRRTGSRPGPKGTLEGLTALLSQPASRPGRARVSALAEHKARASAEGTRHTLSFGQYRLAYEVYGSGDRVLVWLHGLLLDASLSRGLARTLAAWGNRVVLLDLLGHGRSDKPRHAGAHRMDLYARQVLCLLDELGVDQVVLGGVSLGTNVSLLTAVEAPERIRGLVLEMPVLERAVPAAAGVFLPLLLWVHHARAAMQLVSSVASRLRLSGFGPVDSLINAATSDPDVTAAVLHGVLLGPIAPTIDQRRSITAPTLILGHGIDLIHSFSDARKLARQLPNARLIRTHTFAELWVRPARLTAEIAGFLDRVWAGAETACRPSADHVVGPAGAPGARPALEAEPRPQDTVDAVG